MARGRKKVVSLSEQISHLEAEIEQLTETIKSKKHELVELKKQQDVQKQQEILTIIQASGKSMDEIKEFFAK